MSQDDAFKHISIPNPGGVSRHKPVYLVIVENPFDSSEVEIYRATKIDKFGHGIVIKGTQIKKAQAEKLLKNPTTEDANMGDQLEVEFPWQRVKRINNVTYKKAQNKQGE